MPRVDALLKAAKARLRDVETPGLDARLLLQHATGLSHADLIANPDHEVRTADAAAFEAFIARRVLHEPVTRIVGSREFYGRDFTTSPAVLDPRADTEVLIEAVLARLHTDKPLRILDLGTGSGIIAITLLAERPQATGLAVDMSEAALDIAKTNAHRHGLLDRLGFQQSSWLDRVDGTFDCIASNPPYIEAAAIAGLEEEVRNYDPHLALAGGDDGLDCYRAIAAGVSRHLNSGGHVAVEIGAGQANDVTAIFASYGLALLSSHRDLGGHTRCLVFNTA